MNFINDVLSTVNSFAWGPIMIVFLVGTGILLSIGTKLIQYRKIGSAFGLLKEKGDPASGDITPRQTLMAALAATIGTGNIAGVATAIALGGPGAVFWMWLTAIVGGATKFGEAILAVKYRVVNDKGERSGGPMYYCSKGMEEKFGGNWKWLGWLFALFGVLASFGIGNLVQSNSVAAGLETIGVNKYITGIIITILVGMVIIGGIKRIGKVADALVPVMGIVYVLASLIILFINANAIPAAFQMIFNYAFDGTAVAGGLLGSVIRMGVARGVFSNEAGLGSAPIVHAASTMKDPVKQGLIASLGCFIDTIIVCSMTALVILVSGYVHLDSSGVFAVTDGLTGAALTTSAYNASLAGVGGYIVAFGLVFFAFSTLISWFYYGSKCLEFIAGTRTIEIYKIIWTLLAFIGAVVKLSFVWNFSDTFNGLMAIPNLIALLALSPVIFKALKDYESGKGL